MRATPLLDYMRYFPDQRSNYRPSSEPKALLTITFTVHEKHAPALRSAIEEISAEIGGRLVGNHAFAKEAALTDAAIALGALRAAVNAVVPKEDPDYV